MGEAAQARLAGRHAATRRRITAAAVVAVATEFTRLTDPYDDEEVAEVAARMARLSAAAQTRVAAATFAYLRYAVADLTGARDVPAPRLPEALRGVDPVVVYQRPAAEYRYLRSLDVPPSEAGGRATDRARVTADQDATLAMRVTTRQVLGPVEEVTGYRRVLGGGDSCGLCAAAADRLYRKADLLPVHARCRCGIRLVTRDTDPGSRINADALGRLYEQAGATSGAALKRTRVEEHGELGPVLVESGHHFRDEAEAARDAASS